MPFGESAFKIGDVVQRVNQSEAIGVIADVRCESQTNAWNYVVQFPDGRRTVTENAIQKYVPSADPWEGLARNQFSGWDHFVYTLTYHRLRYPPAHRTFLCFR